MNNKRCYVDRMERQNSPYIGMNRVRNKNLENVSNGKEFRNIEIEY